MPAGFYATREVDTTVRQLGDTIFFEDELAAPSNLDVVELADGSLMLLSYYSAYDDGGEAMRGQVFGKDGAALTATFEITAADGAPVRIQNVVAAADGGVQIIYQYDGSLRTQHLDATGTPVGSEVALDAQVSYANTEVVALPGGGFLAAWGSGNDANIYLQRLDEAGQPLGEMNFINETVYASTTLWGSGSPSLNITNSGEILLSWTNSRGFLIGVEVDVDGRQIGEQLLIAASDDPIRELTLLELEENQWHDAGALAMLYRDGSTGLGLVTYVDGLVPVASDGYFEWLGFLEDWNSSYEAVALADGRYAALYDGDYDEITLVRDGAPLAEPEINVAFGSGSPRSSEGLIALEDGGVMALWYESGSGFRSLAEGLYAKVFPRANTYSTGSLAVSGGIEEDGVLTAELSGILDPDGIDPASVTYTWSIGADRFTQTEFRGDSDSISLGPNDIGQVVMLRVTYADELGYRETHTLWTDPVENVNDAPIGEIAITGDALPGGVLTALAIGLEDEDGLGSLSYQWFRDGAAIDGATNATYAASTNDFGAFLTVQASYIDGYGTAEALTSAPVGYGAEIDIPALPDVSGITYLGGSLDESFAGYAANDLLMGRGGADTIRGADGNDTILGYDSADPGDQIGSAGGTLGDGSPLSVSMSSPVESSAGSALLTGFISRTLFTPEPADIVVVLDVSGSTADGFNGSVAVPDANGDGVSNTILDAEIVAFDSLMSSITRDALMGDAAVRLITFASSASTRANGTAGGDANGDGTIDIVRAAQALDSSGGTNFLPPLDLAISHFESSTASQRILYFLSDGEADTSGVYSRVRQLEDLGVEIRTYAVGAYASESNLDYIDDASINGTATVVTDPSLLAARLVESGLAVDQIEQIEVLLNGTVTGRYDSSVLSPSPFGLRFDLDVDGLTDASDTVEVRVTAADGANTVISVANSIFDAGPTDADRLFGNDGDDSIDGGPGADLVAGGAGADSLIGGYGDDTLRGGSGIDTAIYELALGDVLTSHRDTNGTTITSAYGEDVLLGIELLQFSDGLIAIEDLPERSDTPDPDRKQHLVGTASADSLTGGAGDDTLEGSGGDDHLDGAGGDDSLLGGTGTDVLFGGWGYDTLWAGDGDDTVYAGDGRDLVGLGNGNDTFYDTPQGGDNGRDTVWGGNGNDAILGGNGSDAFYGEGGDDYILGRLGDDLIDGGWGYDTLYAGDGNDTVFAGDGRDMVALGNGNDTFYDTPQGGENGRDTVWGGDGNDAILGGNGSDAFYGEGGNDYILGRLGDDLIDGGWGYDTIDSGTGNDTVFAGDGRDFVLLGDGDDVFYDTPQGGENGKDTVYAGAGNDLIEGGNGSDFFYGGSGADRILARLGNDTLIGATGNDTLSGGAGADRFVFNPGDGRDLITDFVVGEDNLVLDRAIWGGGLSATQVVGQFASVVAGDVVIGFSSSESITLSGLTTTEGLETSLVFFA